VRSDAVDGEHELLGQNDGLEVELGVEHPSVVPSLRVNGADIVVRRHEKSGRDDFELLGFVVQLALPQRCSFVQVDGGDSGALVP